MSEILPDGKMNAAEACYSFMGWLTCRDEVSGPFSSRHNAGEAARLVEKFCKWQGWEIENERWFDHIKPYQEHNKPITHRPILPHEEIQVSEQRIKYRTPDNIWHLWTQAEIDNYIEQSLTTPPKARDVILLVEQMGRATLPLFEDAPLSIQEEAALTVRMLYDVLYQPYKQLDHETVQELLSRIDVMAEPLKEMVQALEVKHG